MSIEASRVISAPKIEHLCPGCGSPLKARLVWQADERSGVEVYLDCHNCYSRWLYVVRAGSRLPCRLAVTREKVTADWRAESNGHG